MILKRTDAKHRFTIAEQFYSFSVLLNTAHTVSSPVKEKHEHQVRSGTAELKGLPSLETF